MNLEMISEGIESLLKHCDKNPGRCFESIIEGFHLMLRRGYGKRTIPWSQCRTDHLVEIVQFGWNDYVHLDGEFSDIPKGEFSKNFLPILVSLCKKRGCYLFVECVQSEEIIRSYCSKSRGEYCFERMSYGSENLILRIPEVDVLLDSDECLS